MVVFEFFEARMASVVFSICALESFSNEVISTGYSNGFQYEQQQRSGLMASLGLETVERKLSIDEKLSCVIPALYTVPSRKGKTEWNNFQRLRRLRDRIVHCKARDRASAKPDDDVLWNAEVVPGNRTVG